MSTFNQEIRFARAGDGVRLAYAIAGTGYPLVRSTHWLTNIEFDWQTPSVGPLLERLAARYRLIRYNPRGYGLSEGEGMALCLDSFVNDLETVVDAAGLDRFALYGASGGGPISIAYAARHPDRVSHLVLVGGYARGLLHRNPTPEQKERLFATIKLIELGWGDDNPGIRQMFTSQFFPDATLEQMASFNELQRRSASPKQAAMMLLANQSLDATGVLNQVRCPTLVFCATGDARVPIEEARLVAASIPDARFVPLESNNHVPLAGEPAFQRLFDELSAFLPNSAETGNGHNVIGRLTPRERQVLDLIARGCDNLQIAAHLGMAEKTVRNHITSIFDKIAVESRAQAIVLARDTGLGRT